MRFDWDPAKASGNQVKHGIQFEQAITAFDDPFARVAVDEPHSTAAEIREWLIGESDVGLLVVLFTIRGDGEIIRLISARRANRRERRLYDAYRGFSL